MPRSADRMKRTEAQGWRRVGRRGAGACSKKEPPGPEPGPRPCQADGLGGFSAEEMVNMGTRGTSGCAHSLFLCPRMADPDRLLTPCKRQGRQAVPPPPPLAHTQNGSPSTHSLARTQIPPPPNPAESPNSDPCKYLAAGTARPAGSQTPGP